MLTTIEKMARRRLIAQCHKTHLLDRAEEGAELVAEQLEERRDSLDELIESDDREGIGTC